MDRRRLLFDDAAKHSVATVRCEGRPARAHGVQNTAQAEQIAAMIHRFAARLFGRHVFGRARQDPGSGQTNFVDRPGQPKVSQFEPFDASDPEGCCWA